MLEALLRVLAASALLATLVATVAAQPSAAPDPPEADVASPEAGEAEEARLPPQVFDDPYSAYDAG